MSAPEDRVTRIAGFLSRIRALRKLENRDILLNGLPEGPFSGLERPTAYATDLNILVDCCLSMGRINGQLENGKGGVLAIEKLLENARRFVKDTEMEDELDQVLAIAKNSDTPGHVCKGAGARNGRAFGDRTGGFGRVLPALVIAAVAVLGMYLFNGIFSNGSDDKDGSLATQPGTSASPNTKVSPADQSVKRDVDASHPEEAAVLDGDGQDAATREPHPGIVRQADHHIETNGPTQSTAMDDSDLQDVRVWLGHLYADLRGSKLPAKTRDLETLRLIAIELMHDIYERNLPWPFRDKDVKSLKDSVSDMMIRTYGNKWNEIERFTRPHSD